MLLSARKLVKGFGDRTLFTIEKLEIRDGDRIGLVGLNGAGKSTLLHMLYGDEPCDQGAVERRCEIAFVSQEGGSDGEPDARRLRALSLRGSACKSGGERTRRALAAAFSREAPLLFLDEPTTNLDLDGIETLQRMLAGYQGALLVVSHDRALLDALCSCIWALEDGGLRVFPGRYTDYTAQRERERAFAQFEYARYRAEKARLLEQARGLLEQSRGMLKPPKRMGASEARLHKGTASIPQGHVEARAKGMLKRAEMLPVKERPSDPPQIRMALGAASPVTARIAARVEGLTVRYGAHCVLENASFTLPAGKRTVMLGPNGAGKTTLAEHLARGGECARLATGVRLGYFSQTHDLLDPGRTVLENARAASHMAVHEVRSILANLGISGDAVHKPVSVLSGGERAKTAFARLLASDCNLLVLDEPTNHIDLFTAEALERLLVSWRGTMLVATHDRRLAERLAERLLFVENGGVRAFEGGWAGWREQLRRRAAPKEDLDGLIEAMRRAAETFPRAK